MYLLVRHVYWEKKKNIFTSGKSISDPKRDDFRKHEGTRDHIDAIKSPSQQKEFQRAVENSYDLAKDAVFAQMRTVLWQTKESIALRKNQTLVELQILNGCSKLQSLRSEYLPSYSSSNSVTELYQAMNTVIDEELLNEVEKSPLHYFSLEVDEATDCSNCSVVVMCMKYIGCYGTVTTRFFDVQEVQFTTADSIVEAVKASVKRKGFDIKKLIGIATDGAATMIGVHKGVVTQLKKEIPFLISTHCAAHRLQLVSEKAANNVPYLQKYISVLNQFAKALKFSPKLCHMVEEGKYLHGEKGRKIKQVFFTRWLSFGDAVSALLSSLGGVLSTLQAILPERNIESKAVLFGVLKNMSTFRFVALTYFLADVLDILKRLSLIMQRENPLYTDIKLHLHASQDALEALLQVHGANMKEFWQIFPQEPPNIGVTEYKTHEIKDNTVERTKFKETCDEFVSQLITHLTSIYPNANILDSFRIFDPQNFENTAKYGEEELQVLVDFYGCSKEITGGTVAAVVDQNEVNNEWSQMRSLLKQCTDMKMAEFYARVMIKSEALYPNLHKLIVIALILPVTSVNCERAISRYNEIKSDRRNRLEVASMQVLMNLALEAPILQEFDLERAFSIWINAKDCRKFFHVIKNSKQ